MNNNTLNITNQRTAAAMSQIYFLVVYQTAVMIVSLLGNLFLLFVIFRANQVMKRRVSPVQVSIYSY